MSAHTHDVVPASPQVRRHARRVFTAILVPALLVTLVGAWLLWPTGERPVLETSPPGMTFYISTSGTVTITSATADRISGTFTAQLSALPSTSTSTITGSFTRSLTPMEIVLVLP